MEIGEASRPCIGINPIVDGRDSLRDGQTEAVMKMAKAVARLIERHVRCSDGSFMRCFVPESPTGSWAEAQALKRRFELESVGAIIHLSRAWSYPEEVAQFDARLPQAIWGFSGSNAPGTVFMGGVTSACAQNGIPVFKIYGRDIQKKDEFDIPVDVADKLLLFARCAGVVFSMRGTAYLRVGSDCMGIAASHPDYDFFRAYLDMHVKAVDSAEILRRMKLRLYDERELSRALTWTRANCAEGKDPNPSEKQFNCKQKDEIWRTNVEMTLILLDMMRGNPALKEAGYAEEAQNSRVSTASFQGQRQWTDWMPNSDFVESILNSGFDWNGAREPIPIATEGDFLQAVTMLWGKALTGCAQVFCDVRGYWSRETLQKCFSEAPQLERDGFIYLTNSGSAALDASMGARISEKPGMKPFWRLDSEDVLSCLRRTSWHAAKQAVFRGGGFSVSFLTPGGVPLTMIRLNMTKGIGPTLQVVQGHTIELPKNVTDQLVAQTDPTWPQVFFVPDASPKNEKMVYDVVDCWGSNHCTLCYGHVAREMVTLASMLRIPVSLHNLSDQELFRPDVWRQFGADDPTGADYRACAAFGPLYR